MKFKKRAVLGALLSTGLYLLDNLRERMPDNIDDIKGKARETYEAASDRLGRAADALRGKDDSQMLGNVGALLLGVGIGVGVGLLFAPASGEKTRADIANKVSAFGEKVRERKPQGATGRTEHKNAPVCPDGGGYQVIAGVDPGILVVMMMQFNLRQFPDSSPPPKKEPPDGPENPDVPVREPDPTEPAQI